MNYQGKPEKEVEDKKTRPPADELDEEGCDGEGVYWKDFEWIGRYTMETLR